MPFPVEDVITAEILQTGEDGENRVVIYDNGAAGVIEIYSAHPSEVVPAAISAGNAGKQGLLDIRSPNYNNGDSFITLLSTADDGTLQAEIEVNTGLLWLRAQTIEIDPGTALLVNGIRHEEPTAWVGPALNAPYTNVAGREVEYRRDLAGNIHIRGVFNRNAAADGAALFTLPAGFRPDRTVQFLIDTTPVGALGHMIITSAGVVSPSLKIGAPTIYTAECCFPVNMIGD